MRSLIVLCFALLYAAPVAAEIPLRSPWDGQRPPVTEATYECPTVPTLPRDIVANDYYSDAQHSMIDPARLARQRASALQFETVMRIAEAAADRFVETGHVAAARCVITILLAQAEAAAMTGLMSSNQATYEQIWTVGALSVAYLKVRPAAVATDTQSAAIRTWLAAVARAGQDYMDSRRNNPRITDARNNHVYWAGMAVMAAGIAADDRAMFDWGVARYKDAMRRIGTDGTLPLETDRGARALHYHLFAAAPLVMIAEFAAANRLDLYAADGGALHRLVDRSLSGLLDNSFFAKATGKAQDTPAADGKIAASDLIWAKPYARRFPSAAFRQLMARVRAEPFLYLGGLPPA